MKPDFRLDGLTALVTGAAYGIGLAIAQALHSAGARIAYCCSRPQTLARAQKEYHTLGIEARGYLCDVTDEDSVREMVAAIDLQFGGVDILVNNAGIIQRTPMHQMETADFRRVIDVDLVGPFICAKAVLPAMIERRRGKIINICSLMSELGRETVAAYAAAKGGLKMLTRNICAEYGRYNIQCNAIAPGYIATPQTEPLRQPGSPFNTFIERRTPAARWGTPEDLMGTAVFLASTASDFINGQIIFVDGGLLASLGKTP